MAKLKPIHMFTLIDVTETGFQYDVELGTNDDSSNDSSEPLVSHQTYETIGICVGILSGISQVTVSGQLAASESAFRVASARLMATVSGLARRRRFACADVAATGVDGLSLFWIDCIITSANDVKSSRSASFVSPVDVSGTASAKLMAPVSGLFTRRGSSCADAVQGAALFLLARCLSFSRRLVLAFPGLLFRPVPRTGRIVAPFSDATISGSPEMPGEGVVKFVVKICHVLT
ncbi:hypothetical protein GQX74_000134 [Glossina fuscipes]|nr:hypothetical protein GQX74_000134 [Glossina fuscipes]